VHLGLPPDKEVCRLFGLVHRRVLLEGLDETLSGTREDYRGAFRHINGNGGFC
jgi:hypothetical protein